MDPARPLRDVFADLATSADAREAHAADPAGFLPANGHPELPSDLVSEAIVNYADTAPAEIAEHLAPFVMAHSAVPLDGEPDAPGVTGIGGMGGLDLLATAPAEPIIEDEPTLDPAPDGHLADQPADDDLADDPGQLAADPYDFDFGHGDDGVGDGLDDDTHAAPTPVTEPPVGTVPDLDDDIEAAPAGAAAGAADWLPGPAEPLETDDEPEDIADL